MGVLLVFIDGIGIGPAQESNPFARPNSFLPDILPPTGLTKNTLGVHSHVDLPGGCLWALDATLGVSGLPQSATGQTSLFSGTNAARYIGRHLSGFPTPNLVSILRTSSLFLHIRGQGKKGLFANPFPAGYLEAVATRRRRHATTTAAVLAGGWPLRNFSDLAEGRAVSHDLTGVSMRERGYAVDLVQPEEAGARLARLPETADLVLFEYFLTDRSGHAQDMRAALQCLDHLGAAIQAALENLDLHRHTVFIVSDHGNMEDLSVRTHTRNPVPAMVFGEGVHRLPRMKSLTDVTPALVHLLAGGEGRG